MTETNNLVSPKGVAGFVNLLKAKSFEGGEPKFSCCLIFDAEAQKTPQFARMKDAEEEAKNGMWPKGAPPNYRSPFRDSKEKLDKGFPANCLFISISSQYAPEIIDAQGNDIIDSTELYSGIKGRASLTVYAYDKKGNKGVSFGLSNFQKLANGAPMVSRTSAKDEFGPVDAEDINSDVDAMFGA